MRPIRQIALDMEQVRVAEILDIMRPFETSKTLTRLGAVVDCVYYQSKNVLSIQMELEKALLPSGNPKFKIKTEDAHRSPVNWTKTSSVRNHDLVFAAPV